MHRPVVFHSMSGRSRAQPLPSLQRHTTGETHWLPAITRALCGESWLYRRPASRAPLYLTRTRRYQTPGGRDRVPLTDTSGQVGMSQTAPQYESRCDTPRNARTPSERHRRNTGVGRARLALHGSRRKTSAMGPTILAPQWRLHHPRLTQVQMTRNIPVTHA